MPVEVVQFCWKYNAERLKKLPEIAGCEVCNFISEICCFPGAVCLSSHSALYCELESIWLFLPMKHCIAIQLRTSLLNFLNHNSYYSTESIVLQGCKPISFISFKHCAVTVTPHLWIIIYQMHAPEHWHQLHGVKDIDVRHPWVVQIVAFFDSKNNLLMVFSGQATYGG